MSWCPFSGLIIICLSDPEILTARWLPKWSTEVIAENDHWSLLKTLKTCHLVCIAWPIKSSLLGVGFSQDAVRRWLPNQSRPQVCLGSRRCVSPTISRISSAPRSGGSFGCKNDDAWGFWKKNGGKHMVSKTEHFFKSSEKTLLNHLKPSWIILSKTFTGSSSQFQKFKVLLHGRRCPWKLPGGSSSPFRQSASLLPNGWDDICNKNVQSLFSFIMSASFSDPSETSP